MQWLHSYCLHGLFISHVDTVNTKEMHTQGLHMFCLFLMLTQSIQNIYTHISAPNFLNIQPIFNLKKFWKAETQGFPTILSNHMCVNTVNANCKDF